MANERQRYTALLLAAGAILLIVAGLVWLQDREPSNAVSTTTGEESYSQQDGTTAPMVQVMKPVRRDITHSLTLSANISPWQQATLYAKVPGYLKWMGVDKGDAVKKGQLLAMIDAPEVEQQYRQAEADYEIKRVTFERLSRVWKQNPDVIAKQDVDVAEAAAQAAKYLRDSRRTMLDYTKVSAPFSGIITARFADPGALIQAATGSATQVVPLFTLMDLDKVRVYVSVPQEAALLAKPGVSALITARELPGREFRGTVARTTKALDPATRTLLVEIDLANREHILAPGMFVSVNLLLKEHRNVLALPPSALVSTKSGTSLFVVTQGRAKVVPIKTGLDNGIWVEITAGLEENQDVVVVGKAGLTDGQAVRVSPYNLPAGKAASQKL